MHGEIRVPALFIFRGRRQQVSAKKNPLCDKAHEMYKQGMKLVDIADALEVRKSRGKRHPLMTVQRIHCKMMN